MNSRLSFFAAAVLSFFLSAPAGAASIAPGGSYNQNFNSIGNSATASLPSGWSVTSSTAVRSVTATEWGNAVTATEKQGTGTGTNAGIYNWGDADNATDRGVGFLASNSATKTGNLYLSLTATGYIPSFMVSYDMKCYRNNTRQFQFQLYYSTDNGISWTKAGSDFCTSNAIAASGAVVNPASVTSVSSKTLNVSLSSGETVILCWSYSVSSNSTTSNAQGLGIDNVSIVAGSSSGPAPLAAPTGLSVVSVTNSGFSLSWTAVADADDYEVTVLDSDSNAAGFVTVDASTATAVVIGLSADTAYTAKAKALPPAGSTTHLASDWSVPVSVRTKLADGLEFAPLFDEPFSGSANHNGSWQSNTSILTNGNFIANIATNDGWTGTGNMRKAPEAVLFGTQSLKGTVTTPSIRLRAGGPSNATVRICFQGAKKNGTSAASLNVVAYSASGTVSRTVVLPEIDTASESDLSNVPVSFVDLAVSSPFTVTFEPAQTDGRCYLDNVIVEQIYDPNYTVLTAPTGVAESDVGKNGFTVSWTGVADASGYEVWLNGAVAGSCASTSSSMPLAGLSDDTTYSVQVRALGDNLHYGDSPLSTAISVTTLADAQKIDFTVTGAPTGDVYAGDTVSFTVTAENESTHEAAEVSFSGIAGATFDSGSGAFSWTTTENDVGSHTVTFTSGTYSTNVTITVVSAFVTTNLFHETFAGCDKKWINTQTAMTGALADEADWTFASHCFSGESGLRIGLKDPANYGSATTRAILPKAAPGTVRLSFRAAGNEAGSTMTVTAAGGASFSQTVTLAAFPTDDAPIPDAAGYVFGPYDIAVSDDFTLAFAPASGDGRMGVDEILVVQTVSARLRELAAPTGLALDGAAGENGFTIGWNTVGNATNYAVRVTDATGAVVFDAPFCAATQATVAGLLDDGAYAVRVRATGDPALFLASPWSDTLAVRTERSLLHPTLSFGGWRNAVGDGGLYAGVTNAAAVSAVRDNGSNAVVALGPVPVSPAPDVGPAFAGGILSWTPADADTNKTFTVSFLLDGAYATNLSFTVLSVPPLQAPDVTVGPVAWNAFGLSWDPQYRAASYGVRAWTDCPNPNATPTRVEEPFVRWPDAKPFGWTFDVAAEAYKNANAPVKFENDGQWMATYDLGGTITNVSFVCRGSAMSAKDGKDSVLTLYWSTGGTNETDWIGHPIVSVANLGSKSEGVSGAIPPESGARVVVWKYSKASGGVGVGSVAIEGTGFTTPRWLTGWGPAAKSVGSATACTVAKARPGKALGPDPANPREDLFETRANYAEVSAFDAAGAFLSTIVRADVPAPPRNVRATMMIVR